LFLKYLEFCSKLSASGERGQPVLLIRPFDSKNVASIPKSYGIKNETASFGSNVLLSSNKARS
jgi:hypothetical protein